MVWESYPVIPIIFLMVGLIWAFTKLVQKIHFLHEKVPDWEKKSLLIYSIVLFIFLGIGYGKWSRYPFRWSDAFYSTNHSANQLAINPVLYFLNTYTRVDESYNMDEVQKVYPVMAEFLGVENPDIETLNYTRMYKPKKENDIPPNIIIIILETFPAFKCGALGNPADATPHFDSIAEQSLFFTQFYVPKLSTAASIFSILTGLPDMAIINKSSTRDPFAIDQDLFVNQLKDYKKYFFIGGSANWGDLNGFLNNNIEDITIYEEGSYSAPETNAWGISDYHLLQEMHHVLLEETEPFVAIALTAGHHRPYTIPRNIQGFDYNNYSSKFSNYGFGKDEYYAFTFMDFSLGEFIKKAESEDYYNNTLFVVFGDHGSHGRHLNLTHGDLSLHSYHVPMIMYGPGFEIAPTLIDDVISAIDVFPTLFTLLNIPFENSSLGRNILSKKNFLHTAFLFSASSQNYGLVTSSQFVKYISSNQFQLFDPSDRSAEPIQLLPDSNSPFLYSLAESYYELARYLRYKNSKTRL